MRRLTLGGWGRWGGAALALALLLPVVNAGARQAATGEAQIAPAMLAGLRYRMIGPFRGGRVTAVAGIAGDDRTFYMGATGGGVWKTTDAGESWVNLSDPFFTTGSVGAVAVAPSDPRVVYVGTGSTCIRNNVEIGRGAYKSTDAGATWQPIGLDDVGQIGRIEVSPTDANLVYVAALGHAFGPNPERGVYRSRDGGKTWQKVLFVNDHTGAVDLQMDGHDPKLLYAAFWTGERQPWGMVSGGTDGGVYKTTDGGDNWTKLGGGLPAGPLGRIGIALSPARPGRLWAIVDAAAGGVYRTDDGGTTFTRVSADRALTGRSWYYAHIFADPKNPDEVYAGNTDFFRSTDGGATFTPLALPHGDNHALWIDPADTRVMIEGNDGGATVTLDGGKTWSSQLNQPTAEIYRVVTDDQVPYRVYGSQQDQYDALSLPSRSIHFGERLQLQHWYTVGGYEGGFVAVDPKHPSVVYSGGSSGLMTRMDLNEHFLRNINVTPPGGGRGGGGYRFAWDAPIFISPNEPGVVYHTSNVVHRTADGGQSWTAISPDLTRDDKTKENITGGPGTEAEAYPTVAAFAESPRLKGVLWAGSDDGLIHLSRDNGAHWTDVTPKAMPDWATVNTIEPSPEDPARAYVAAFRYMLDDYHPYIFRTTDYGQTWTLLTHGNGIPEDQPVRVVREDPVRAGLLYAGTEFGMWMSPDDGGHWQSLQLNLPATPITDIAVHNSDLDLSTNGRSFWILDDISPLRRLAAGPVSEPTLITPRDSYRITTSADEDDQAYVAGACCVSNFRDLYTGARIARDRVGDEPPDGVIVYAAFPDGWTQPTTITVLDAGGKPLRTLLDTSRPGGPAATPGLHRLVWNLRVEGEAPGARPPVPAGPKAPPGTYQVRLISGARTQTVSFHLGGDPNLRDVTAADYQAQYDTLSGIIASLAEIQQAGPKIAAARAKLPAGDPEVAKLDALQRQLGASGGGRGGRGGGGGRGGRGGGVTPLSGEFTSLYTFIAGSEDRPTAGAEERYEQLRRQLAAALATLP